MKHTISALILTSLALLSSCDDGHVDDPVFQHSGDGYEVLLRGSFSGLSTWSGGYSVVAAAFDGDSPYSLMQKVLSADGSEVRLSAIPASAQTVEIAVVNSLRKRIATLYRYDLSGDIGDDIVEIDCGNLDASMWSTINRCVLQGSATNCSMCHGSATGAAGLDLSAGNAYASLINVPATKGDGQMRVLPFDSEHSFFYKVLTDGDGRVSYSHTGLFAEEKLAAFLDVIRAWIDSGAGE